MAKNHEKRRIQIGEKTTAQERGFILKPEKRRIQIGEKTTAQERGFILKPSRERFIEQSAH